MSETHRVAARGLTPDSLIRKGLKLTHLRFIVALRDTGQVSAAADSLSIAQPAASRLLSQLEDIVGAELHRRHPRGVDLTENGLVLAERAQRMLRDLDDAAREIAELSAGRRGHVSVGSVTGPALELVLPVIRQLRVTHPGIDVSVTVDTSGKLGDAAMGGNLDFYVGRILGDADPGQFDARVIGEEPLSLIARPDHPLTRRGALRLADCIPYDWILQTREGLLAQTMEHYLAANGLPLPTHVLRTSSLLMTLAMIERSNAIAPVSRSVAEFYGAGGGPMARLVALPVAESLRVSAYALIRPKARALSPASQIFFDSIARRIEADPLSAPPPAKTGTAPAP